MELELSIEDLLNKRRVESDRIEFKTGWNPDDIYRSVCAYANDFDNQGGGYIVIGAEEKDGVVVRPVIGVPENQLDKIQREILGYNNKIRPAYHPKVVIDRVDEKYLVVLWVLTGTSRPYKCVNHVTSKKDNHYRTLIRYGSSTVEATPEQERELIDISSREPFDTKGNPDATFDDISPLLLTEHLKQTGSKLAKQVNERGVQAILEEMQLLTGPPERLRIMNVALMMFCETPDRFFPYMQVDMVKFPDGSTKNPNNFREIPPIKGSVPQIIQRALEKIKDLAIENNVDKVAGQAESVTSVSYPYEALEEAVVNAFYHRDYMSYEPVHIEIEPDCINIISYPGIDRSISKATIQEGQRFTSRIYRNRRLGEFLHELDLCEGHSTGIPTIQEELENIGSHPAIFETDDDRRAVCVTIPIHPRFRRVEYMRVFTDRFQEIPVLTYPKSRDALQRLADTLAVIPGVFLPTVDSIAKHIRKTLTDTGISEDGVCQLIENAIPLMTESIVEARGKKRFEKQWDEGLEKQVTFTVKMKVNEGKPAIKTGDKKPAIKVSNVTQAQIDRITEYMKKGKAYTSGELADVAGVKASRVREILSTMLQLHIICAEGENKNRRYYL